MKRALYSGGVAIAAVLVLLVLGTIVPRPFWHPATAEDQAPRRILLLSNPIHTDIAIPLDEQSRAKFASLIGTGIQTEIAGARYLVFGWGGRAFYIATPTWSDLRPGPLFNSLTIDQSVMHVDVIGDVDTELPFVTAIEIGDRDLERLEDHIVGSFAAGPDGPIRIADAAYGDFDAFYEAKGYFNALVGCNTWTAAALRAAGLKTGVWTPLPQLLEISLALHN